MSKKQQAATRTVAIARTAGVQRYEYRGYNIDTGNDSKKFWEPQLEGRTLTTRFGRIGVEGQVSRKSFPNAAKAEVAFLAAVREKLLKGYKPAAAKFTAERLPPVPPEDARVLVACCVGEHVFAAAFDLAAWLTACIHHGVTPKQFQKTWNRFLEGDEDMSLLYLEDEVMATMVGSVPKHKKKDSDGESWEDVFDEGKDHVVAVYTRAVELGATRFIMYDADAFCSIVAVRGDPGAKMLREQLHAAELTRDGMSMEAALVQRQKEREEIDAEQGIDPNEKLPPISYPKKLAPGAPIACMSHSDAHLRDGTRIRYEG